MPNPPASKKTIEQTDVASKRVLIRVDFNVPLDGGKITDDQRIKAALPTIKSVIDRGGKAILMSHLGRPEGKGFEEQFSLKPVAKRLGELLGKDVAFPSTDCTDAAAASAADALGDGQVMLLENLRFHPGEKKGADDFAAKLAKLGEVYVNDAFGTCHRTDASMVAVPRHMQGPKVVGLLVEKELRFLAGAINAPEKPMCVILGGAKVSDKLPAIHALLPKADHVLIGGAMAYTFLKALGQNVGASRVEEDMVAEAKTIIDEAARLATDMHLPVDHICSTEFSATSGDIDQFEDGIKDGFMGLDIGLKTQGLYAGIIGKSKTIVWNGPMGVFEWGPFSVGTKAIARAMANAAQKGATAIVGGGDSAAAVERFGMVDQMTHVSTGGGASVAMLEGKAFEAVDLLDNA